MTLFVFKKNSLSLINSQNIVFQFNFDEILRLNTWIKLLIHPDYLGESELY